MSKLDQYTDLIKLAFDKVAIQDWECAKALLDQVPHEVLDAYNGALHDTTRLIAYLTGNEPNHGFPSAVDSEHVRQKHLDDGAHNHAHVIDSLPQEITRQHRPGFMSSMTSQEFAEAAAKAYQEMNA